MKTLHYVKAHHAGKLMSELQAAIPALRPVVGALGLPEAAYSLTHTGTDLWLTVPDAVDEAAVAAVVNAHDGAPPAPTQDDTDLADVRAALTGAGNLSNAQVRKALALVGKRLGWLETGKA